MLKGLKRGGTFLLNSLWDAEETKNRLPNSVKRYMAANDIQFYIINATKIAEEIGLGNRTNTIMQSAFFKISGVIPYDQAVDEMKKFVIKSFGRKGEDVVRMNHLAVERGGELTKVEIPAEWANLKDEVETVGKDVPDFIKNIVFPINAQKGDDLPVSAFLGREDGTFLQEQQLMKSVVLLLTYLNGSLKTVSSVTSVLMFVLTLLSVLS